MIDRVTARYLDFQPGNLDLRALRREALDINDPVQVLICDIALDEVPVAGSAERRKTILGHALARLISPSDERRLSELTRAEALEACADAIELARIWRRTEAL